MPERLPEIWNAVCDLMGGPGRIETTHWGNFLAINLDKGDRPGRGASQWHWDDPHPRATLHNQRLGLVILALLSSVPAGKGGTLLAPQSVGLTARLLASRASGVDLGSLETREAVLAQCDEIVEAHGELGDVYLLHPLMLHGRGEADVPIVRVLANPSIRFREPMRFDAAAPESSLVEQAVIRAIAAKADLASAPSSG